MGVCFHTSQITCPECDPIKFPRTGPYKPMALPPVHTHQFTIPVETKQLPEKSAVAYEGKTISEYQPARTIVTKLRCACGEEIER